MKKKLLKIFLGALILATVIFLGTADLPGLFREKPATRLPEKPPENKAILLAGNKSYDLRFNTGDSLYEAMNELMQEGKFSFHAKSFAGLGYFADEINGEMETENGYWVYYVNGAKPSVGIGDYKLKPGDKINWKKEKINP